MNGILTSYKINQKYIPYLSWLTILLVLIVSYLKFPLHTLPTGDEPYYSEEAKYLFNNSIFNSLAQGTSFFYSILLLLFSGFSSIDYVLTGRLLSVVFFLASCRMLLLCLSRFQYVSTAEKYLGLIFFGLISSGWLWRCLPDMEGIFVVLSVFYLLTGKINYKITALCGVLLFLGFGVKPTELFTIPGFALYLLLKNLHKDTRLSNVLRTATFVGSFSICFIIYHLPGYVNYHKLMLESKDHTYAGNLRVENKTNWVERSVYFDTYNPNHKLNKWQVTWAEVDSFKAAHPDVNLRMGYFEYLSKHSGRAVQNLGSKLFMTLPYSIQSGYFFAKWTTINRFIRNYAIIQLITLILIFTICAQERDFIKHNSLIYIIPALYYLCLCIYVHSDLEENWLLFCLPFLALPVGRFLSRRINILLLIGLQVLYIII
jgi:hypothetical protein